MIRLHPLLLVLLSMVVASIISAAVLLALPGIVSERLLVAGLLVPILTTFFAIYLNWQDSNRNALLVVGALTVIAILLILVLEPVH